MPHIARAAGRLTGRAVGTFTNLRARVESAADVSDISAVQRDLREGLTQLNAIRDEIRSGFHPLAPGCVAQALTVSPSWPQADAHHLRRPLAQKALWHGVPSRERPLDSDTAPSLVARGAADKGPRPWSGDAAGSSAAQGGAQGGNFAFFPISAAALGRMPARVEGRPITGGDIMEQALAEERLACEATQLVSRPGALDAAATALAASSGKAGGRQRRGSDLADHSE